MGARSLLLLSVCAAVASSSSAYAIDASNVLVLYNNASADGQTLANYYAQVHPGVQLLGLDNVPAGEEISAADYLTNIATPVLAAANPNIDVILTTKGLPLRVRVDEPQPQPVPPNPLAVYTDAYGQQRQILSWERYSSLESELTKVDYIASELMMGDQSFTIGGHFTQNPYYLSSNDYSHAVYGTRLAARLDAFTVDDAMAAVDRAQNAYVVQNNGSGGPFRVLVDNDPSKTYAPTVAALADDVLEPGGVPYTYENTTGFLGTSDDPVIGYVGHGANQSGTPAYQPGVGSYATTSFDFDIADGAVFSSWESFNAYSFEEGNNLYGQALLGEWIAAGGTAAVGNVHEPHGSPAYVINEDQMFQMLLDGKTFAEAAWSGARQLSYVNTVVGDPLMTWKSVDTGDANLDGVVDIRDFFALMKNWDQDAPDGLDGWLAGDFDGDGHVYFDDLAWWDLNRGAIADWATVSPQLSNPLPPLARAMLASMPHQVPEPSTWTLLAAGMFALGGYGVRRRRRRFAAGRSPGKARG